MKKMFLHKVQFGLPTAEYFIVFLSVLCKKKMLFKAKSTSQS